MKREIKFVRDDFQKAFDLAGIDWESITEREWSKFENMFCDATHWDEVAEVAAAEIAYWRDKGGI